MRGLFFLVGLFITITALAESPIELYETRPDTQMWTGEPREYYSDIWQTEVVTNVSVPTLMPYLPDPDKANGVGVVVAPGGGYHALSIVSEGQAVAQWLNERGIAAFVLSYRLVPSGEDAIREMSDKGIEESFKDMSAIVPLAGADGLRAMEIVRNRADEFGVNPDKVGFMGFSAGGAVTLHVAYQHDAASKPAFVAPIYAANRWYKDHPLPDTLPPAFILAATDDQLGLAIDSIELYKRWLEAKVPVELHMYARGGHGFGMRTLNLPSDNWIERFGEWLTDWQNTL